MHSFILFQKPGSQLCFSFVVGFGVVVIIVVVVVVVLRFHVNDSTTGSYTKMPCRNK